MCMCVCVSLTLTLLQLNHVSTNTNIIISNEGALSGRTINKEFNTMIMD